MRRVIVLALAAALLVPAAAQALTAHTIRVRWSKHERTLGSQSGAYAVDLSADRVLVSRNANRRRAPASNEKLLTTAAALIRFGPAAQLSTTVVPAPGAVIDAGGVLRGDLYLVGAGDPSLNDVAMRDLVDQLQTTGVTRVAGAILGDETLFDARRGSYDSGWAYDSDLGGALGGLTWGHGRTDSRGPAYYAASRLRYFLKLAKVRVTSRVGVEKLPDEAGEPLATHLSPTIAELISITNHPSDNFYAETLLKLLGARYGAGGTTAAGVAVAKDTLRDLGVRARMVDGSGLSRSDRVSPRNIVRLLAAMAGREESLDFRLSLAAPAEWGTLESRMTSTAARGRCRAKTGTLNGVSALSGYCTTTRNHLIAFSLLENGVCAVCAKRLEDRMVPLLARYTG